MGVFVVLGQHPREIVPATLARFAARELEHVPRSAVVPCANPSGMRMLLSGNRWQRNTEGGDDPNRIFGVGSQNAAKIEQEVLSGRYHTLLNVHAFGDLVLYPPGDDSPSTLSPGYWPSKRLACDIGNMTGLKSAPVRALYPVLHDLTEFAVAVGRRAVTLELGHPCGGRSSGCPQEAHGFNASAAHEEHARTCLRSCLRLAAVQDVEAPHPAEDVELEWLRRQNINFMEGVTFPGLDPVPQSYANMLLRRDVPAGWHASGEAIAGVEVWRND